MTVDELRNLCRALAVGMSFQEKVEFVICITGDMLLDQHEKILPSNTSSPIAPAPKQPNQSRILACAGDQCVCSNCKKVAYSVVGTVYAEGMSGEEFLACFNPEPPVPVDMLTDEHGNECVDCPLCKGDKTVVFLRRS